MRRKTLVALLVVASALANAQPVAAKEARAAPTVSALRAEEVSGIGEIRLSAVIDSGGLKTSWRIAVGGFVLCEGPFRVEKRPPKEPLRVAKGNIAKNVMQAEVSGRLRSGNKLQRRLRWSRAMPTARRNSAAGYRCRRVQRNSLSPLASAFVVLDNGRTESAGVESAEWGRSRGAPGCGRP